MSNISIASIKELLSNKLINVCANVGTLKIDSDFNDKVIKQWTTSPTYVNRGYTWGRGTDYRVKLASRTFQVVQTGIYSTISGIKLVTTTTLSNILDDIFADNNITGDFVNLTNQDYISRIIQTFFNKCIYLVVSPFTKKSCYIFIELSSYKFSISKNLNSPYTKDNEYSTSLTELINNEIQYLPANHIVLLKNTATIIS